MADNFQFSIPLGCEDSIKKLAFAHEHKLGVEVAAFATGPALCNSAVRTRIRNSLTAILAGFDQPRSYHGAFIDLSIHSGDPGIAAVSRDRIERDMETASHLACGKIVFHTGFNPLVPVSRYEEEFVDRHAAFWPQLADEWPDLVICLENLWEPCPHLFERLFRNIEHPRVGVCLDVAHAHVNSDFSIEMWIERLRGRIVHMHWNDNHGDVDSHLPVGAGSIRWEAVLSTTQKLGTKQSIVLELGALPAVQESLSFLSKLSHVRNFKVGRFLNNGVSRNSARWEKQ